MLVAFFKPNKNQNCNCEIAKFVDRIWLEKSGDLICIRTFIIYVKDNSESLSGIRMLVPFRNVFDLIDLSSTCLDEAYILNAGALSDGGYEINIVNPEKTQGTVSYDFFKNVEVSTENIVKAFPSPKTSLGTVISIEFTEQPINAGKFRLFRYSFKITSVLDKLFPAAESKTYSFEQSYFEKKLYLKDCEVLDIKNLEVPVNKWFDPEIKQGGFDVFLYLSEGMEGSRFNFNAETTSNYRPDGSISEQKAQKFILRARLIFPDKKVDYLQSEKSTFFIHGIIQDPYALEGIRKALKILEYSLNNTKKWTFFALSLAAISLIVFFIGREWIISKIISIVSKVSPY